jgi:hypothetical protein
MLRLCSGNNIDEKASLQGRKGTFEIVTTTKTTPKPQVTVVPSIDVNITWLLQHINNQFQSTFSINRSVDSCRTPRRNSDIEAAMSQFRSVYHWCSQVNNYFMNQVFPVQTSHGLNLSAINPSSVFVPVVPLFEQQSKSSSALLTALESDKDNNNSRLDNKEKV